MKIGFQGIAGAYSELAGKTFFKDVEHEHLEFIGMKGFADIFKAVELGSLDMGMIPIENSLAGSVHKNIDLLNTYNLKIIGEIYVRIEHNLLAKKGTNLENVKNIYSHWQALAQCEEHIALRTPHAMAHEYFDTAGAALFVANSEDRTAAAVASSLAAQIYNLEILIPNFEDDENNYTRFVVIHKSYDTVRNTTATKYKTSITFSGRSVPGFLYSVLKSFATRNINLTKIESRPIPEDTWNYFFYIDFAGKFDDIEIRAALSEIKDNAPDMKILGSYPLFQN